MRKGTSLIGIALFCVVTSTSAVNPILGEVELEAASKVERNAGVWLDEQYVGYVKNLHGKGKLVLVPGEHRLLFKLNGYQDSASTIVVEPGEQTQYRVTMHEEPNLTYPEREETARLRISVEPEEAAIFVNDAYAGHVDRFNGRRGMRLESGTYQFTIALPGYQAFETELTLLAGQSYEIKTKLLKGSFDDQAAALAAIEVADTTQ